VSSKYSVGSIHLKGDLPYGQARLRKTAKALIVVIRPQNAAAHPSSSARYAGLVLYSIAATISSARKIGSNTGGTSHSRKLNEEGFDI
jgi:hypothetical protein